MTQGTLKKRVHMAITCDRHVTICVFEHAEQSIISVPPHGLAHTHIHTHIATTVRPSTYACYSRRSLETSMRH